LQSGLLKALGRALLSPVIGLSWLVLSVSFAISGPFGTYEHFAYPVRMTFWFSVVGGALALGVAIRATLQHLMPAMTFQVASFVAAVLTGGLVAAAVPPAVAAFFPGDGLLVPGRAEIMVVVASMGFGIALMRHLLTPEMSATAQPSRAPRLMQRLPDTIRGRILHLCAGDHYVEVATERGRHRILMRFSDAIEEVVPLDGLRVHRSHWVARDAVAEARRAGGRLVLLLNNGTEVPVSRAYEEAVSALGLF
jgi:hypothetical protein